MNKRESVIQFANFLVSELSPIARQEAMQMLPDANGMGIDFYLGAVWAMANASSMMNVPEELRLDWMVVNTAYALQALKLMEQENFDFPETIE